MNFEVEINQEKLAAGPASELDGLLALTPDDLKAGKGFPCVVDVRKAHEIPEKLAPRFKDLGVKYVQVPLTVETFSEQDMDAVRREFARHWGRVLVVSQSGARATFLVLAHTARVKGWSVQQALDATALKDEEGWVRHLTGYLSRHPAAVIVTS